jgi:integrase
MLHRKAREMGLGPLLEVSLVRAREKAAECRRLLGEGSDPIDARNSDRARKALEAAKSMSFATCAERFINSHKAGWKNPKHVDQWRSTINTYCEPIFGPTAVQDVDTALILKALEPIWAKKPETASRVRGRVERVLDWAKARGYRHGENPARWRGHLDKLLPKLEKKKRVKHHPALPYRDIGAFMADLRAEAGFGARALELLILTSTLTIEIIGARWPEIDLENATWVIPAERMKAHKEHRVPLSAPAVKLLRSLNSRRVHGEEFVFVGPPGRHLSDMAMLSVLRRMKRDKITVHGFRSTFRDWAAETTNYPHEVCEMALAHAVSNEVEAAYRRGDLFEKRRRLMIDWAKYCGTVRVTGEVVSLKPKRVQQAATG